MSQNSSNSAVLTEESVIKQPLFGRFHKRRWWMVLALPVWVFVSFVFAQVVVSLIVMGLDKVGLTFDQVNQTIINTIYAIFVYALTLLVVIGIPYKLKKIRTSKEDIAFMRLPFWSDLLLAPAGFVVYLILSSLLTAAAIAWLPWFDASQAQNTGFSQLHVQYEYILAFFTLVVLAPLAEEILFRGYLFGKLKKYVPVWLAIIVTSLLFGAIHGSWNLGVDTFALSIVLCFLRQISGSLWASILLHMIKNGIAFYLLFIAPLLIH